jgi:hypothetical protein
VKPARFFAATTCAGFLSFELGTPGAITATVIEAMLYVFAADERLLREEVTRAEAAIPVQTDAPEGEIDAEIPAPVNRLATRIAPLRRQRKSFDLWEEFHFSLELSC